MKTALLAAAAFLLLAATQAGDWGDAADEISSSSGFESSKALCRQVRDKQPPATDRPDAATARTLTGCDSEALYYGIGMKADPERARLCAFVEMEQDSGAVMSGRTMLMTIYANGVGAKRDLDVALHLACGIDGAPMESHGRVEHLAQLKAEGSSDADFHFCDDITSGLAMGYCAAHQARIEGAVRDAALARLIGGWSASELQAFARLRAAQAAFVEAHGSGEVDLAGTARGAMVTQAEEALSDEFLALLQQLAAGRAPRFTAAQFRQADAKLNAAYRQRLGEADGEAYSGAVTRAGVRDAQRAWLRYRDAFLAFAAVKFRSVSRDSLAAWLTEKRTKMLLFEE